MRWVWMTLISGLLLWNCGAPSQEPAVAKKMISTADAPAAIGPYSQAVLVGNTLYCSGQIAIDPKSGQLVTSDIEAETRQVLDNLGAVLRAAGMQYQDVVRATVYLADINDYGKVNAVYSEYFRESKPARAAMQVAHLPKSVNVEISCIAVKTVK